MFSHFMQFCLGYNGNKKYFFWEALSRVLATAWYKLKASTRKAFKREAFQIFAIILPTGDVCLYSVFHSAWEGENALVSFDFPVHLHYSCPANLPDFITVSQNTYCSTEMLSSYRHTVLHFLLKATAKWAEKSSQFSFLFPEIREAMSLILLTWKQHANKRSRLYLGFKKAKSLFCLVLRERETVFMMRVGNTDIFCGSRTGRAKKK